MNEIVEPVLICLAWILGVIFGIGMVVLLPDWFRK